MVTETDNLLLKVEPIDTGIVVRLLDCEILSEDLVTEVQDQLLDLIVERKPHQLFLDLTGVHFLSSTGLAMLIRVNKSLEVARGHLIVCGVQAAIREVFEVTQLTRILDIRVDSP